MCDKSQRRKIEISDPAAVALFSLLIHLPLLALNRGEFTDGILQLNVLRYDVGLYPPLFGALAHVVSWVLPGVGLEMGGRIVSVIAASLLAFPVCGMCKILTGGNVRASRAALVFMLCSPLLVRWSLHAMSDMLFTLFATCTMWFICRAIALEKLRGGGGLGDKTLAVAVALGAAAAMTRYQGALLAVPGAVALAMVWKVSGRVPWHSFAAATLWLALPAWMWRNGFGHGAQFAERTTGHFLTTLGAYLSTAETFVLTMPYFFTFPLMIFAAVAVFKCRWSEWYGWRFLALWAIWGAVILVLQSVFQTFQYRYFMPLLPVCLVLAGAGVAWLCEHSGWPRWAVRVAFVGACVAMTARSAAVLFGHYQSFGDQRLAMRWITENLPENALVFGNERYGTYTQLGCPKWDFWSGRTIRPYWTPEQAAELPSGSVIVLSDAYGGAQTSAALSGALARAGYQFEPLASFTSTVLPVFDDVMAHAQFNQNPLGWVMRYDPQELSTRIVMITKK